MNVVEIVTFCAMAGLCVVNLWMSTKLTARNRNLEIEKLKLQREIIALRTILAQSGVEITNWEQTDDSITADVHRHTTKPLTKH